MLVKPMLNTHGIQLLILLSVCMSEGTTRRPWSVVGGVAGEKDLWLELRGVCFSVGVSREGQD